MVTLHFKWASRALNSGPCAFIANTLTTGLCPQSQLLTAHPPTAGLFLLPLTCCI